MHYCRHLEFTAGIYLLYSIPMKNKRDELNGWQYGGVVGDEIGYRLSPVPFLSSFLKKKIKTFCMTLNDIGCFYSCEPA